MPISGLLHKEKDALSMQVIRFFEKMRMSYLSALSDPKNYRKKWVAEIKSLREQWDDIDDFAKALKEIIDEKNLFSDEVEDIESDTARKIYENVKELRYSSEMVKDPFAKKFGEDVLEALLENEAVFAAFVHWAMRSHDKALPESSWEKQGINPDTFTEGYKGLNLKEGDIVDFIVEHYGDGKDTKRIKGKYTSARNQLEEVFLEQHSASSWKEVVSLEKAEKGDAHF